MCLKKDGSLKKQRINFSWERDQRNTNQIYMKRGYEETHYTGLTSMKRAINKTEVKKMIYHETQIKLA